MNSNINKIFNLRWWNLASVLTLCVSIGCSAENKVQTGGGVSFAANGGGGGQTADTEATGVVTGTQPNTSSNVAADNGRSGAADVKKEGNCVDQNVQISRQTPLVMFVVDRSGSTSTVYGQSDPDAGVPGITRWQALHDAIMDPSTGVVAKIQGELYLGITLYDGGEDMAMAGPNGMPFWMCYIPGMCDPDAGTSFGTCPRLITVPPAKNNYDAIAQQYNETNAYPGGTTPTALALEEAYAQIEQQVSGGLDKTAKLTPVVILVTDGEPNSCGNPFVADYQGPADQVAAAAKRGIRTFVVGIDTALAGSLPEVQSNLDNLAKLGNTGINVAYTPTSKEELSKTLISYIGKATCEVILNGKIAIGYEGRGKVSLNSEPIGYNDNNGYKVTSEDKILLQGKACDRFSNDATIILHAEFPCEGVVLK